VTSPRAAQAGEHTALYWMLADVALTPPDGAFVERLQRSLTAPLREALPQSSDAAGIERMAVDYTRLFAGLRAGYGLAPPLESLHEDSPDAPGLAAALQERYADAGFELCETGTAPDHLGVELRFVALLCYLEMQAWQSGRAAEAERLNERQREFLHDHLGRWAPERWRVTAAEAEHPFYRLAAGLAAESFRED
jgi:TorA maturation chaperone TorD